MTQRADSSGSGSDTNVIAVDPARLSLERAAMRAFLNLVNRVAHRSLDRYDRSALIQERRARMRLISNDPPHETGETQ